MPLLILLLSLCFAAPAWAVTVNSAHPRLFVNASTLTTVRAQAASGAQNDAFRIALEGYVSQASVRGNKARFKDHLAYWILTNDNSYQSKDAVLGWLDDALAAFQDANYSNDATYEGPVADGEGSALGRVSYAALAVDWLWADLTAVERTAFANFFATAVATDGADPDRFGVTLCADSNCEPWRGTNNRLCFLIVAKGETGDATKEAAIQDAIDEIVTMMDDWVPCKNLVSPNGEQGQYAWVRWMNYTANYLILKSGTDYTGDMDTCTFMRSGLWFQHRLRPRLWISSKSRYYNTFDPAADKWNIDQRNPLTTHAIAGALGDNYSLHLAKYLRTQGWNFGTNTEAINGAWAPLFLTSTNAGTDWATRPKSVWSEKMGWFSGRQTWNLVTDGSDTGVRFNYFGLPFAFNNNPVAGHFQMYRGDDNVLTRSGWRGSDFDNHYYDWDDATYARNCFTIYRAADDTDETRQGWSPGCPSCVTQTRTEKNYGKQEEGPETDDLVVCNYDPPEDYGVQKPVKRGELNQYVNDDEFTLIATTNDGGQDPDKQQAVARSVLWLKLPNDTGQGFALVWDRATLEPGVTAARAMFHMVNVPHLNGTITATAGGGSFGGSQPDSIPCDWDGLPGDPWGGVYRSTNTTAAWFDDGNSRGVLYPLYASDGGTTTARLYAIGGPNKLGEHWKQTWSPCATSTASANLTSGSSYEFWHSGRNHPPGIYADGSGPPCGATIVCADGTTTTRCKIDLDAGPPTFRNDRQSTSNTTQNRDAMQGNGADACDWRLEYGWDNLSIASGPRDVDLVTGVYAGPNTIDPDDLPTVYGVRSGDVFAFGYQPNGGSYSAIVVPSPDTAARLTSVTYTNPLYGHSLTGSQTHRITMLEPDRQWAVTGVSGSTASDENGTLVVSIPASTETIEVTGGNTPAPVPDPDPGATYTLVSDPGYHPRARQIVRSSGGTVLALYWSEGGPGTPIWAQVSQDDGQTWRDFDGSLDSQTELVPEAEVFGAGYVVPRADATLTAALDPSTDDLWLFYGTQRTNGSYAVQAGGGRIRRYPRSGSTWETSPAYTLDLTEASGSANSKIAHDGVIICSRFRQAYAAWRHPKGAGYAIHSIRAKASSGTAMAVRDSTGYSAIYPQIVEQPEERKIWLLASIKVSSTQDSIRACSATDGSSAQWGATTRIPAIYVAANGEFAACRGPSGPFVATRDNPGGDDRLSYAYWTGSAWATGATATLDHTMSHLTATAAGIDRVVVTTRQIAGANPAIERAYWSLADGWSPWETIWPATEGLAYPHVVATSPNTFTAWAWRTAGVDGFEARSFAIPAPVSPEGACCVSTACTITTAEDCAGAWQGADTACSPNPCIAPPANGACCYPDGSCAVTTEDGCGGTYQGDATDCDPNPCPSGPPDVSGRRRRVLLAGR